MSHRSLHQLHQFSTHLGNLSPTRALLRLSHVRPIPSHSLHYQFPSRTSIRMTGSLTIYHNPNCSKSREAKSHLEELAEQKKFELKVVEYLNGSLTDDEVKDILGFLVKGKKANEDEKEVYAKVLRDNTKELSTPEDVLAGLEDDRSNLQRPIIVNWDTQKAVVCRPFEEIHEITKGL